VTGSSSSWSHSVSPYHGYFFPEKENGNKQERKKPGEFGTLRESDRSNWKTATRLRRFSSALCDIKIRGMKQTQHQLLMASCAHERMVRASFHSTFGRWQQGLYKKYMFECFQKSLLPSHRLIIRCCTSRHRSSTIRSPNHLLLYKSRS